VLRSGPPHRAGASARLALLLLIASVCAAPAASAEQLYVSAGGNDQLDAGGANDCDDDDAPCLSIGYAISVAAPNDEIVIAPGTYPVTKPVVSPLGLVVNKPLWIHGDTGVHARPRLVRNAGISSEPLLRLAPGSRGSVIEHLDFRLTEGGVATAVRVETASSLRDVAVFAAGPQDLATGEFDAGPVRALHFQLEGSEAAPGLFAELTDATIAARSTVSSENDGTVRVAAGEVRLANVDIARTEVALLPGGSTPPGSAALASFAAAGASPPKLVADGVAITTDGSQCAFVGGAADEITRLDAVQDVPGGGTTPRDCVHVLGDAAKLGDLSIEAPDQVSPNSAALQVLGDDVALSNSGPVNVIHGGVHGLLLGDFSAPPDAADGVAVSGGVFRGGTDGIRVVAADGRLDNLIAEGDGAGGNGVHVAPFQAPTGPLALTHVTAVGTSRGALVEGGAHAVNVSLENTIAAGGSALDLERTGGAATLTATNSLFDTAEGLDAASADNLSGDPLFAAPGDFHILDGSPAQDTASGNPFAGPLDFEGDLRTIDTAPDIGADEFTDVPLLSGLAVRAIGTDTATFAVRVDTRSSPTTYRFEFGAPGFDMQTVSRSLEATAPPGEVTELVTGLRPDTRYDIRAVATNSAGTAETLAGGFTTMPPPVSEPPGGGPGGPPAGGPSQSPRRPFVRLKARKRQRLSKQRNRIRAFVRVGQAGRWRVVGRVKVVGQKKVYRVKTKVKRARVGKRVRVRIKLKRRVVRAVKRALVHRKRVVVKLTARARTTDGQLVRARRRVRLR
jgi:hypothetical protein